MKTLTTTYLDLFLHILESSSLTELEKREILENLKGEMETNPTYKNRVLYYNEDHIYSPLATMFIWCKSKKLPSRYWSELASSPELKYYA